MKTPTLIILLFLALEIVSAQPTTLSQSQVEKDIDVFVAALQEGHPGLDIHLNPTEVDSLFKAIKTNQNSLELSAFYTSLVQTVASIQDGHTDVYEGSLYRKAYPYLQNTLPFDFWIIDGQVYISNAYENSVEVPLFSQVLSINGKSMDQILDALYALTPADGNNVGFKEAYTEKILSRQIAKLIGFAAVYEVEVRYPDHAVKTIQVRGINDTLLHQNRDDDPPLHFELNSTENYALLTVNTFLYRKIMESGIDFHKFLKRHFKALRKSKIENLILDVRENYGGHNMLALTLYAYVTQGKFKAMLPSLTKLHDTTSVSPYSNYPDGEYPYLQRLEGAPLENGMYELRNEVDSKVSYDSDFIDIGPNKRPQNISKNKFKGSVYCLTSGLTFSAAANFTSLLSRNENVTFIGQAPGGANGVFCGGGFYLVTLPNSGFQLQIPFFKRCVSGFENSPNSWDEILDYPIEKELESRIKGEDTALNKAKELIKLSPINPILH